MWYGLVIVAGVAFSGATEFIPEINEKLRLVPFTDEFKKMITSVMVIDYAGCWIVEQVFKRLFSDYRPKDIALRRPEQLKFEADRKARELEALDEQAEEARLKAIEDGLAAGTLKAARR